MSNILDFLNNYTLNGFTGPFTRDRVLFLIILLAWSLVIKGIALWKSARRAEKVWFAALLLLNTFGILELLYIFAFSRSKKV
ncbi:MAG TPA: DUF5652 family protein [Candidatus Paceibacterota bacterium]